jgi:hypothetical protein
VSRSSLAARLGRLEQRIPEPAGPIVYHVFFHDGTPVWPRPDDDVQANGPEIVYRIASWEETELDVLTGGPGRRP